jgi:serine acetyltransferase
MNVEKIKSFVNFWFGFGKRGCCRISLIKTLYFNFRVFPFRVAVKFPVHVFVGVKLMSIGKVSISGTVQRGMVTIGRAWKHRSSHRGLWYNVGTIVVAKGLELNAGVRIINSGTIEFDKNMFNADSTISCSTHIKFGYATRVGVNTLIEDNDHHYLINLQTKEVKRKNKGIEIGKYCWIGQNSSIKKGVRLSERTVVASNSVLTKDYSDIPPYSIIGGVPAKLIATGFARIYDNDDEITKYFATTSENTVICNEDIEKLINVH